jgi:AcrR family transcriptional regulator
MTAPIETTRAPLTRDRVVTAAVALADDRGIDDLTMRKLGQALGVEAMSLYNHVAGKDDLLDGMVDLVFAEIDVPQAEDDWRTGLRRRCVSARAALARHRWATGLTESRTSPGPATLRHHDAVIGCFLGGGFSFEMTAHAYAVIDSYLYGYALQEANLPATGGEEMAELAASMAEQMPMDAYPYLAEFTAEVVLQPGYDFADEFEFGLGLILDGLAGSAEGLDS